MKKATIEDNFEQNDVRRTCKIYCEIGGVSKTLCEWAEQIGAPRSRLYSRWRNGDRGYDLIRPEKTKPSQPPDKRDIRKNITRNKCNVTK